MSAIGPVIVYDDDCGFCTWSVEYAMDRGEFVAVGFSELTEGDRRALPADFEACSHFVTREGTSSCGAAAEEVLKRMAGPIGVAGRAFARLPAAIRRPIREPLYRLAADNRDVLGSLVDREPPSRGGQRPHSE